MYSVLLIEIALNDCFPLKIFFFSGVIQDIENGLNREFVKSFQMVLLDYGCILQPASGKDCQKNVEMYISFDLIYLL